MADIDFQPEAATEPESGAAIDFVEEGAAQISAPPTFRERMSEAVRALPEQFRGLGPTALMFGPSRAIGTLARGLVETPEAQTLRRTAPVRAILGAPAAEREALLTPEELAAGRTVGTPGLADIAGTMFKFGSVPPPAAEAVRATTEPLYEVLPAPVAGTLRGVREVALTMPIAMGAVGLGKNVGRAIGGIFTGEFLFSLPEQKRAFDEAVAAKDYGSAAQVATQAIVTGGLLAAGAAHELKQIESNIRRTPLQELQRNQPVLAETIRRIVEEPETGPPAEPLAEPARVAANLAAPGTLRPTEVRAWAPPAAEQPAGMVQFPERGLERRGVFAGPVPEGAIRFMEPPVPIPPTPKVQAETRGKVSFGAPAPTLLRNLPEQTRIILAADQARAVGLVQAAEEAERAARTRQLPPPPEERPTPTGPAAVAEPIPENIKQALADAQKSPDEFKAEHQESDPNSLAMRYQIAINSAISEKSPVYAGWVEQLKDVNGKPVAASLIEQGWVKEGRHYVYKPRPTEPQPQPQAPYAIEKRIEPESRQPEYQRVSPQRTAAEAGNRYRAEQGARGQPAQVPAAPEGARPPQPEVLLKPLGQVAEIVKPPVATLAPDTPGKMRNLLGDPLGTTYHATPSDWEAWQQINADFAARKPGQDVFKIFGRREALKNKYGGMPPEPPRPEGAAAATKGELSLGEMSPDAAVMSGADRGDYYRAVEEAFRAGKITKAQYEYFSDIDPDKWPKVKIGDMVYVPFWKEAGKVTDIGYGGIKVQYRGGKSYLQPANLETLESWQKRHPGRKLPTAAAQAPTAAEQTMLDRLNTKYQLTFQQAQFTLEAFRKLGADARPEDLQKEYLRLALPADMPAEVGLGRTADIKGAREILDDLRQIAEPIAAAPTVKAPEVSANKETLIEQLLGPKPVRIGTANVQARVTWDLQKKALTKLTQKELQDRVREKQQQEAKDAAVRTEYLGVIDEITKLAKDAKLNWRTALKQRSQEEGLPWTLPADSDRGNGIYQVAQAIAQKRARLKATGKPVEVPAAPKPAEPLAPVTPEAPSREVAAAPTAEAGRAPAVAAAGAAPSISEPTPAREPVKTAANWLSVPEVDVTEARAKYRAGGQQIESLRKEASTRFAQAEEIGKQIKRTTGPRFMRGRIKASAPKKLVAEYERLRREGIDLQTAADTLRKGISEETRIVEEASTRRIVNDPNEPLVRRLALRTQLWLSETGGKAVPAELAEALHAALDAEILRRFPDASKTEILRLRPALEVAAQLRDLESSWRMDPALQLQGQRSIELDRLQGGLSPEMASRLYDRAAKLSTEPLGRAELDQLIADAGRDRTAMEKRAAEEAAAAEREAAKAAELEEAEKKRIGDLVREAEKTIRSGPRRSAVEIKKDLIAQLTQALQVAPTELGFEGTPKRIVIAVPRDGVFVLQNSKTALTEALRRAQKLSTATGRRNYSESIPSREQSLEWMEEARKAAQEAAREAPPPARAAPTAPAAAPAAPTERVHPVARIETEMQKRGWTMENPSAETGERNPRALTIGGRTYPTIVSADGKVKIAFDATEIFEREGEVWVGDPSRFDPKKVTVQGLVVEPTARRQGLARAAMKELQQAADQAGMTLVGEPAQIRPLAGKGALTTPQLVKFYKGLGWKQREPGSDLILEYKPKSGEQLRHAGIPIPGAEQVSAAIQERVGELTSATVGNKAWWRRYFTSARGLPRQVPEAEIARLGAIRAETRDAAYAARQLIQSLRGQYGIGTIQYAWEGVSGVPKPVMEQIQRVLTGEADPNVLAEPLRAPVERMRNAVDRLSSKVSEILRTEGKDELAAFIDENMRAYLTRSYRIFDDPNWVKKIPRHVRRAAEDFIAGRLREADPAADAATIQQRAEVRLREMLADWSDSGLDGLLRKGKLGAKDLTIFMHRKDIAPEIRAVLGEYGDPITNYVRTVTKQARFLADTEFLGRVREVGMGRWLFEEGQAPAGFEHRIAAESSSTMAPLNGLRTSAEIAKVFSEFNRNPISENWLARMYFGANAWTRQAATVFSLLTQARNLLGNPLFNVAAGHWNFLDYGKAFKTQLADIAGSERAAQEFYRDMARHGLVDENPITSELRAAIQDAGLRDPSVEDYTMKGWVRLFKTGQRASQRLYRMSDEMGKQVAWLAERDIAERAFPEMPEAARKIWAAERVRNSYPTYSMLPEWVRGFRKQPLFGPFVPFAYERFRNLGWNLRYGMQDLRSGNPALQVAGAKRMAGTMAVLGAGSALGYLAKYLFSMSDDVEDDVRRFLPRWSKNSQLVWLGKSGTKIRYLNWSYLNPDSQIADAFVAAFGGSNKDVTDRLAGAFSELVSSWTGEQMGAAALEDVLRNQTPDGAQVYNPQAEWNERWAAIAGRLLRPLLPGTVQRVQRRILPAVMGRVSRAGQPLSPTLEIGSEITGLRSEMVDLKSAMSFKARDFVDAQKDARQIATGVLLAANPPTIEAGLEAYRRADDARFQLWQEMHKDMAALLRQGATRSEIVRLLSGAGVSGEDASRLYGGRYNPLMIASESYRRAGRPINWQLHQAILQERSARFKRRLAD